MPAIDTRQLLRYHGLRPKKGLGQHFLVSDAHLKRIVQCAEVAKNDTVLEIGAGLGALTSHLAREAGQVVAVELDERLIPLLQQIMAEHNNVTIVQGDILQMLPSAALEETGRAIGPYKIVANLPYSITSAVLRHVLEDPLPPESMVVTVQEEVAERMCAEPPKMSVLAVSVQFYSEPSIVHRIPPGAFYPRPDVDSAVVRLLTRSEPAVAAEDVGRFFRVVRAGFSQKRKQLRNSLSAGLHMTPASVAQALQQCGIDPRRRAQTLRLQEWGVVDRCLQETIKKSNTGNGEPR